jgi:hypothetical protein
MPDKLFSLDRERNQIHTLKVLLYQMALQRPASSMALKVSRAERRSEQ